MKCRKGITVKNQLVPCGQCVPCRINKQRKKSVRILMEMTTNYQRFGAMSYFLTLTYNDDHVPRTVEGVQTLRKKTFLKWLSNEKKAEKKINPQLTFRYFAVGEYGKSTRRPHYHVCVFPRSDATATRIGRRWSERFGFVKVDPVTPARARYISNYTVKGLAKVKDLQPGMEAEFATSSKKPGLGYDLALMIASQYKREPYWSHLQKVGDVSRCVRLAGQYWPLDNYLLKVLREECGIPLLHRDRLSNPAYYDEWAYEEFAESLPHEEADLICQMLARKLEQGHYRGKAQKV